MQKNETHPGLNSQLTINSQDGRFQAINKRSSKGAYIHKMKTSAWFDDPVVGNLPPEEAAAKLREVGEEEAADMLEMAHETQAKAFEIWGRKSWWPFQDKPWQH